jgi:8-oxo-dGTP diphosphatase
MDDAIPSFGVHLNFATYRERPGAYAVIFGSESRFAFVQGRAQRLFLPGGGIGSGERPEEALMREIMEEVGWTVRILGSIGLATQFLFAEGEGYFAIRASYFRAVLTEHRTTHSEHEIVWLPAAVAVPRLARESDGWAISKVCNFP